MEIMRTLFECVLDIMNIRLEIWGYQFSFLNIFTYFIVIDVTVWALWKIIADEMEW